MNQQQTSELKERVGYNGKSQQWQYGFDLACRELQAQVDADKWISVKDRLPEKEGFYLVFTAIGTTSECQFHCDEFVESYVQFQEVTHWQLLPEPPKGIE